MASRIDIEEGKWFVGADITLQFPVVDDQGAPQVCTGWAFEWEVRAKASDQATVLSKTTAALEVDLSNYRGVNDQVNVHLVSGDTMNLGTEAAIIAPGTYQYGLHRVDSGNRVMVAYGTIVLTGAGAR